LLRNLLKETIDTLVQHGKTGSDVYWVGNAEYMIGWDDFVKVANVDYNDGYGSQEVAADLVVVGDNWWLERCEYDGSEWWGFKTIPTTNRKYTSLQSVIGRLCPSLHELNSEQY